MSNPSKVYDGLRNALAALNPVEEVPARNALIKAHAISWNEGMEISSDLAAFRSIFKKIEDWERRQPSN